MIDIHPLVLTALSIGFVHTLFGPDHYLPFIVMSKARSWATSKTLFITFLCGLGHVLSSVVLGIVGVGFGIAVQRLKLIESVRGDLAAWVLTGFGIAYTIWGIRIGIRAREHDHDHDHSQDGAHHHTHHHLGKHAHVHGDVKSLTPWMLFVIFVLGPCEPLIPILMYPASQGSWALLTTVTLAFSIATIGTMTIIVWIVSAGWVSFSMGKLEPFVHAIAGLMIALSGFAILFLGL